MIVFKLAANKLHDLYLDVNDEVQNGNLDRLPELHAISCCLKAVCTNEAVESIQICRRACGGHGYLNSSGFHDCYGNAAAAQAYEGENTVMFLQTARFLMKALQKALNGEKLTPTVQYFETLVGRGKRIEQLDTTPRGILKALQAAAAGKIALAAKRLQEKMKTVSIAQATNQIGIEMASAAELHCQVFFLQSAIDVLEGLTQNKNLSTVFNDILDLYAVDLAIRYLGDLLLVTWCCWF